MSSDYPFGIFKHFLLTIFHCWASRFFVVANINIFV